MKKIMIVAFVIGFSVGAGMYLLHERSEPLDMGPDTSLPTEGLVHEEEPFRVEITIGYTVDRVTEFADDFAVKVSGHDPQGISEALSQVIGAKTPSICQEDLQKIESFALNPYMQSSSGPLLLFLASYYLKHDQTDDGMRVLDLIVAHKDPLWGSFALCLEGVIHETRLQDPVAARKAYSRIFLEFPESVEVDFASRHTQ